MHERWPKALPAFCEAREGDHTWSDESEYVDKLLFWTFLWAPKPLVLNRKRKVLSNRGRGGIVQTLVILVIHKLRPQESYSSATEVKLL